MKEEEFIQNRTRAGARFLTRWDQTLSRYAGLEEEEEEFA